MSVAASLVVVEGVVRRSMVVPAGDGGPDIETSRVVWGERVEITADAAISALEAPNSPDDDDDAGLLLEILSSGPLKADDFKRQAASAGIRRGRFEPVRAALRRDGLIVRAQEPRPGGGAEAWWWHLPDHTPLGPQSGSVVREVCDPNNQANSSLLESTLPGCTDVRGVSFFSDDPAAVDWRADEADEAGT